MKLFRKINTSTGLFIEDALLMDGFMENDEFIETEVPQGFYWPRWNGTEWVEGGVAPEPQPHELAIEELLMMAIADLDAQREADKLEQQLAMAELAETMMGGTL
jgi:hypothetical protein